MRALVRLGMLSAADAGALIVLRPDVGVLARHLTHPDEWTQRAGLDAVAAEVAGALVWLLALWLAVGLVAALVARAPGALGRGGTWIARTVLPRSLHRLVAGAAGVSILFTPAAAGAAAPHAAAPHTVAPHTAVHHAAVSCAAGPGGPGRPGVHAGAARPPLPAPAWPTSPSGPLVPATPATPASADRVVVHPGDSLWLIAATRLGPQASAAAVARQWPRWYAANRATIGPDPDLLHPGQVLHAPARGGA